MRGSIAARAQHTQVCRARLRPTVPFVRVPNSHPRPLINVELPRKRFGQLRLKQGETVYVSARRVRLFLPGYAV